MKRANGRETRLRSGRQQKRAFDETVQRTKKITLAICTRSRTIGRWSYVLGPRDNGRNDKETRNMTVATGGSGNSGRGRSSGAAQRSATVSSEATLTKKTTRTLRVRARDISPPNVSFSSPSPHTLIISQPSLIHRPRRMTVFLCPFLHHHTLSEQDGRGVERLFRRRKTNVSLPPPLHHRIHSVIYCVSFCSGIFLPSTVLTVHDRPLGVSPL